MTSVEIVAVGNELLVFRSFPSPPPNLPRKQGRSGRGCKSPLPPRERVRVRVERFCIESY